MTKSLSSVVVVVLVVSTLRGGAFAGVVMAETSFAAGPEGSTAQNKTIYVQGNKQKVERERIVEITDLDKNLVYIIDKNRRVFTEIPLQALTSGPPENVHGETILTKTGTTRVVANHPCHEYRAVDGNKLERATISACVSTDVPGAQEIAEFDHKMIARLGGHKLDEDSIRRNAAGLILEKQSVLSFRIPDQSRGNTYHTTSLIAKTRVNKIQLAALPPETFKPPTSYRKLQNRPGGTPPVDSDSDHAIRASYTKPGNAIQNQPTSSQSPYVLRCTNCDYWFSAVTLAPFVDEC